MKLYLHKGIVGSRYNDVPNDVTHLIIDRSVTVIVEGEFSQLTDLMSVYMFDNVKRIERKAFWHCDNLQFVRFSNTLEYIGKEAFECCGFQAIFLPSTLKWIGLRAFGFSALSVFKLPDDIDVECVGDQLIYATRLEYLAEENTGTRYLCDEVYPDNVIPDGRRPITEWLIHHMDDVPLHKICYSTTVTSDQVNDYISAHGNDVTLAIEPNYGMTPLHILSQNPNASSDVLLSLLMCNMETAFIDDDDGEMPLDHARNYNVLGLVSMLNVLCNHRSEQQQECLHMKKRSRNH